MNTSEARSFGTSQTSRLSTEKQDAAVERAASQCVSFLDTGDDVMGHRPGRYPAFRWRCRDVLFYQWLETQHVNVVEMTAFLTELRRRAGNVDEVVKRFFCVIDSLVSLFVLGKDRSSSTRLNRISRRIASFSMASGLFPITLWAYGPSASGISLMGASRAYEPK